MSQNARSACQVAMESALERAMDICESEEDLETAMDRAAAMLGLNPHAPDCEEVLDRDLDEDLCADFEEPRRHVLCMVFNPPPGDDESLLDQHDGRFGEAVQEAWDRVNAACEAAS